MKIRFGNLFAALTISALVLAGCGGDDAADSGDDDSPDTTEVTTTTVAAEPLRILVTNDDGVGAAGIDALVEGLRALPDTEVTVVAPATNQSGSGGKVTDGALTVADATTASGFESKAVQGFPADTIVWAIDQQGIETTPDLVISGINEGQNLGPVANLSGTIGAARAGASRGIPALAVSQGFGTTMDYSTAVELVLDWVAEWRASGSTEATVENINVPSCGTGTVQELQELPAAAAANDRNIATKDVDCTVTVTAPADDVDAFNGGHSTLSVLSVAAS